MLPLEVMKEDWYECEIFAIDSKDDPNFVKWVNVVYYKNIFQYLFYLFKNRKAIIYSNSLTIKTLLVGMIWKKTVFMAHDQTLPIESKKLKRIIVLFFYRFFSTIRVINKWESELLDKYGIKNCIVPLALSKSFYSSNLSNRNNGIFIWNLYEDKDPEFLINVIKEWKKKGTI